MNPTWDKVLKLRAHGESARKVGSLAEASAFLAKAAELEKLVPETERVARTEPRFVHRRPSDDIPDFRDIVENLRRRSREREEREAAERRARARRHLEEELASGCARYDATPRGRARAAVSDKDTQGARVLRVVTLHGPIGARRLSGATGIKLGNVRWHLRELEKAGLVEDVALTRQYKGGKK